MKNGFYIMLNMRTAPGFETFGEFVLGDDSQVAKTIFDQLQGNKKISYQDVLHLDLVEYRNGLPIDVTILNSTLEELATNCRIISKELFRLNNLDKDDK